MQEFPALPSPSVRGLLLPQVEPPSIGETAPYRRARWTIQAAKRIALIGYSFGAMDDLVAYSLLKEKLMQSETTTIVVMPDPYELAMRLKDDVRSSRVYGLAAYWDLLAPAIMIAADRRLHKSCDLTRHCSRCVAHTYYNLLDSGFSSTLRGEFIPCGSLNTSRHPSGRHL